MTSCLRQVSVLRWPVGWLGAPRSGHALRYFAQTLRALRQQNQKPPSPQLRQHSVWSSEGIPSSNAHSEILSKASSATHMERSKIVCIRAPSPMRSEDEVLTVKLVAFPCQISRAVGPVSGSLYNSCTIPPLHFDSKCEYLPDRSYCVLSVRRQIIPGSF